MSLRFLAALLLAGLAGSAAARRPSPSPSPTGGEAGEVSATATPNASPTALPSATLSASPTAAGSPSASPSASATATATPTASPSPSATPSPETAVGFVAASVLGLDAELGLLSGGPLTSALGKLASRGAPVRLLLDPASDDLRRESQLLLALSPTVKVRWKEGAGRPQRRLLRAGALLLWRPGRPPRRADQDAGPAQLRFDETWNKASPLLPEVQRLEDELRRLPDPTENQPRYIRRREGGARDESDADHEDPSDQGRTGAATPGARP